MKFSKGGLFWFDRDETCFIKYLVAHIQSVQLRLKNEQWDVNTDFEECIAAIRKFGDPICVSSWWEMRCDPETGYLRNTAMGYIDIIRKCEDCPFGKDTSWRDNPEILNGIKLVRDAFARTDSPISDFIEYNICRFFPHLLQTVGSRYPEYLHFLRKHYTAPKLFCEDIETETGECPMLEFLHGICDTPLMTFYQALAQCQERLYFPLKEQYDDEGYSWSPTNGKELWSIAFDIIDLLTDAVRLLPQLEEQYFGKKSELDITQLIEALNRHIRAEHVPESDQEKGVSLKQLARRYYSTSDCGKGNYEHEITNLNERMRKVQSEYPSSGRGKYNALLFSPHVAAKILQVALIHEKPIPFDKALILAQTVSEDIQKPSAVQ